MLRFLLREIGRRNAIVLFSALGVVSLLDLVGIAVIFPFLKLLMDPALADAWLGKLGLADVTTRMPKSWFVLALGGMLVVFYSAKTLVQVGLMRLQFRILAGCTSNLTDDLTSRVLGARYATFQQTAASEIAGTISVTPHAAAALAAIMQAANDALLLLLMFLGFLLIQPAFALGALVLGSVAVALVYYFVVRRSVQIASTLRQVDIVRYRLLFSIATAIRDIKIMGLEGLFEQRNSHVSGNHARLGGRLNLYNTLPRMLVEFFALLAIVVLSVAVVLLQMPMTEAGPLLGLIVIATLRAIPSFSRLMASLNVFGGSGQYVRMLMDLRAKLAGEAVVRQHDHLEFKDAIELKDVSFRYGSKDVLVDIGLRLGRNQSIGIVGSSGAGKTTLLDIFTGLQEATSGGFTCDGVPFNPFTSHAMQGLIGYVPQSITLLDESIAFNVSFEEVPDVERVMRALTSANLLDLVSSLPEGIQTRVGENGLRISGGQRQRVGIARALYRLPEILVFDEATSSLDAISESELVSEIEKLRGRASIVIVAHRLSTVMSCDRIYVLSGGRIEASGSHAQLLLDSETYRRLYASQG